MLVAYLLSSDGRAKDEEIHRQASVLLEIYGDRLRYSGQYVLPAAVALGRATVAKEGRSYVYSIKG